MSEPMRERWSDAEPWYRFTLVEIILIILIGLACFTFVQPQELFDATVDVVIKKK